MEQFLQKLNEVANRYNMDAGKLFRVIEAYADTNPEYTVDPTYTVGLEPTYSGIILNPDLDHSGSGWDGIETDPDPQRARIQHLKKRLQSRLYHRAADEIKNSEMDDTVSDDDLENCVEPGTEHRTWEQLLAARRKKLAGQSDQLSSTNPDVPGTTNGIAGGAVQS